MSAVGDRDLIRFIREQRGLTRYELDRLCGFPEGTLCRFETLNSPLSYGDCLRFDLALEALRTNHRTDYRWMRDWRDFHGYSVAKAAKVAGVDWRTWKTLERGKNQRQPHMAVRVTLAALLANWVASQQPAAPDPCAEVWSAA